MSLYSRLVTPVIMLGIGAFALVYLQWKLDLGSFADSPQHVVLQQGGRAIVGGGRASLDFSLADGTFGELVVRCSKVEQRFRLGPSEMTPEVCGVRVGLTGIEGGLSPRDPVVAVLEVIWETEQTAELGGSL